MDLSLEFVESEVLLYPVTIRHQIQATYHASDLSQDETGPFLWRVRTAPNAVQFNTEKTIDDCLGESSRPLSVGNSALAMLPTSVRRFRPKDLDLVMPTGP